MPKQEITFEGLLKSVQQGLTLLHVVRRKAIKGVGCNLFDDCPIAKGFEVWSYSLWKTLSVRDRTKLKNAGWNGNIYNRTLGWIDDSFCESNYLTGQRAKEAFLRKFLRLKTLPKSVTA